MPRGVPAVGSLLYPTIAMEGMPHLVCASGVEKMPDNKISSCRVSNVHKYDSQPRHSSFAAVGTVGRTAAMPQIGRGEFLRGVGFNTRHSVER